MRNRVLAAVGFLVLVLFLGFFLGSMAQSETRSTPPPERGPVVRMMEAMGVE